jgi:signal transduction histidine kinase
MSHQDPAHHEGREGLTGAEGLARALRTHEVDAIVGDRDIMFVRLKQAEDELESSRDQLRALASHLLSVRDSERVAIARELHDEFGQALTSLQLGLAWLARNVMPGQQPLLAKIRSLSDATTGLIRSVKNITVELRPGALDELGLAKTLRSSAREFETTVGIPCGFRTNAFGVAFNRPAAIAVFRIVQAALTNVARHARASSVRIALMKNARDLLVTVKDDGKGISQKLIDSQSSLGICGMRERTLALGGTFTLAGSRREGTLLRAQIPLSRVVIEPARLQMEHQEGA